MIRFVLTKGLAVGLVRRYPLMGWLAPLLKCAEDETGPPLQRLMKIGFVEFGSSRLAQMMRMGGQAAGGSAESKIKQQVSDFGLRS